MKEEKVKITGMSCSACANRVQKVVGKLDGVEEANVNFATETLNVKYDNDK
ncbi:MAG: cation transporter, partial [Clostridium sp.]